jgi:hypothetical protein
LLTLIYQTTSHVGWVELRNPTTSENSDSVVSKLNPTCLAKASHTYGHDKAVPINFADFSFIAGLVHPTTIRNSNKVATTAKVVYPFLNGRDSRSHIRLPRRRIIKRKNPTKAKSTAPAARLSIRIASNVEGPEAWVMAELATVMNENSALK